jgi:thioredoxin reductase
MKKKENATNLKQQMQQHAARLGVEFIQSGVKRSEFQHR